MYKHIIITCLLLGTICTTSCTSRQLAFTGIGAGGGAVVGHNQNGQTAEGAVVGGILGLITERVTRPTRPAEPQHVEYTEQEYIKIKKRKVIVVEESVPVQQETRRFYYRDGRKIYIDR